MLEQPRLTPTDFIELTNMTLNTSLVSVLLEGEVASFKISQGKWVFFDLKDEKSSVACFLPFWEMRVPLEDGMKIVVEGSPRLTQWGKFSVTIHKIKPIGEGSLKKAKELLKEKLKKEGIFELDRKRKLPEEWERIGVISSTQAAGYADFIKIINVRWGGAKIQVAHTQVQGLDAPDQMIRALEYFNKLNEVEIIAILRGGGSADDLAAFNDEKLVRAVFSSKIPVITGIGHEIDESLVDLAADVRAATPSHVAEILTKDRKTEILRIQTMINQAGEKIQEKCGAYQDILRQKIKLLEASSPEKVLSQGYAILRGKISPGELIQIVTAKKKIEAKIKEVHER